MGSKTIRLDDEAYDRLRSRKREGETFSDVVKRIAGERSLLEIAGILSEEEGEALEAAIRERRESRERELDRIADDLRE